MTPFSPNKVEAMSKGSKKIEDTPPSDLRSFLLEDWIFQKTSDLAVSYNTTATTTSPVH